MYGIAARFSTQMGESAHGLKHACEAWLVAFGTGLPEAGHAQDGQIWTDAMQPCR